MYKQAYSILKDSHLAEDAVHAAFLKVIKYSHKIGEINCPRTRNYLVIISRTTAIDIMNKQSREYSMDSNFHEYIPDKTEKEPLNMVLHNETVNELEEIINGLPFIYRDAILLSIAQEHSRAEIAELCGISIDAVDKRLQRAKNMVRTEYERRHGYEKE